MPSSHTVFAERGLVHTVYSGKISVRDMMERFHLVDADPAFRRGMDSIIEFRDATGDIRFDDVYEYVLLMKDLMRTRGPCRWALVVPENFQLGLANMIASLVEDLPVRLKPFRTFEEALGWITGT